MGTLEPGCDSGLLQTGQAIVIHSVVSVFWKKTETILKEGRYAEYTVHGVASARVCITPAVPHLNGFHVPSGPAW